MSAARGHARPKSVPKIDYTAMKQAGQGLRFADVKYGTYTIDEVIADALKAGMTPAQIILQFNRRRRATEANRKGKPQQGQKWWSRRPRTTGGVTALFWYH